MIGQACGVRQRACACVNDRIEITSKLATPIFIQFIPIQLKLVVKMTWTKAMDAAISTIKFAYDSDRTIAHSIVSPPSNWFIG